MTLKDAIRLCNSNYAKQITFAEFCRVDPGYSSAPTTVRSLTAQAAGARCHQWLGDTEGAASACARTRGWTHWAADLRRSATARRGCAATLPGSPGCGHFYAMKHAKRGSPKSACPRERWVPHTGLRTAHMEKTALAAQALRRSVQLCARCLDEPLPHRPLLGHRRGELCR